MIFIQNLARAATALDHLSGVTATTMLRVSQRDSMITSLGDIRTVLKRTDALVHGAGKDLANGDEMSRLLQHGSEEVTSALTALEHAPLQAKKGFRLRPTKRSYDAAAVSKPLAAAHDAVRAVDEMASASPGITPIASRAPIVGNLDAARGGRLTGKITTGDGDAAFEHEVGTWVSRQGAKGQAVVRSLWSDATQRALKVHVYGAKNVPAQGAYILTATHGSYLDPLINGSAVKRTVRSMTAQPVLDVPVLGKLLNKLGSFPIIQRYADQKGLRIAHDLVENGTPIIISAEGRMVMMDPLGQPRNGAAFIALTTGTPIVPSASYGVKPKWTRDIAGAGKHIVYGEPIPVMKIAHPTNEQVTALTEKLWTRTSELHDRARAEYVAAGTRQAK